MLTIKEISSRCAPLLEKYGVTRASLYGSVARGEARADSDIDMIVSLEKPIGLFKFFEMQDLLEEMFGRKVDLATPDSLNPHLASRIIKDIIPIYMENTRSV